MADEPINIRQSLNMPPEEMLRYLGSKDYRLTVDWAEAWHDDHVRAFTVAKVAQYDLLEMLRGSIDDAWRTGKPIDQWKAELIPQLQKRGWWGLVKDKGVTGTDDAVFIGPRRLENIFVTNFRMAGAAASWKGIQAAKKLLPYIWYRTRGDEHVRHSHQLLNNIVLPVDHDFWKIYFPPNDWGCRCTANSLSKRELERRGLTITPDSHLPQRAPRLFWRPGVSTPEVVPPLVGPGFGYNPGVSYLKSFEPPRLDGPLLGPSLAMRGPDGPIAPLPLPPQRLPADIILPGDIGDAEAIGRFVESFRAVSAVVDDELVFTDATGHPVVISPRFFNRADGSGKLTSERRANILLLAEVIRRPDEIWRVWEKVFTSQERTTFRWRLTRRYVASYEIEGRTRQAVVAMQVGKDGWNGVTAFPAAPNYIEKEQVRGGVLAWRRVGEGEE